MRRQWGLIQSQLFILLRNYMITSGHKYVVLYKSSANIPIRAMNRNFTVLDNQIDLWSWSHSVCTIHKYDQIPNYVAFYGLLYRPIGDHGRHHRHTWDFLLGNSLVYSLLRRHEQSVTWNWDTQFKWQIHHGEIGFVYNYFSTFTFGCVILRRCYLWNH
jgi:hypothetical protein